MYKEDLALNNLQWLMCCKTKPNQNSNRSIWSIDRTLATFLFLGQSGPESNYNEWVLHILKISWNGASLSDAVYWETQDTSLCVCVWGGSYFFVRRYSQYTPSLADMARIFLCLDINFI